MRSFRFYLSFATVLCAVWEPRVAEQWSTTMSVSTILFDSRFGLEKIPIAEIIFKSVYSETKGAIGAYRNKACSVPLDLYITDKLYPIPVD